MASLLAVGPFLWPLLLDFFGQRALVLEQVYYLSLGSIHKNFLDDDDLETIERTLFGLAYNCSYE